MAVGLHAKIVWADLEYAAMIALPLFWLQVVVVYARRRGLSRTAWVALGATGGALYLGIVVNPYRSFRVHPTVVTTARSARCTPTTGRCGSSAGCRSSTASCWSPPCFWCAP